MEFPSTESLRISPRFSAADWQRLSRETPGDWTQAAEIVRDRLEGRFLRFADSIISDPFSGFAVLAIDSLLLESLQQFRDGIPRGHNQSKRLVSKFLTSTCFRTDFTVEAAERFYGDIRCGLLHQAEAKNMWLIRRRQPTMLRPVDGGKGFVIDVERFHRRLREAFEDYLGELVLPESQALRANLWKKMDAICDVRNQRGIVFAGNTEIGEERRATSGGERR